MASVDAIRMQYDTTSYFTGEKQGSGGVDKVVIVAFSNRKRQEKQNRLLY
jgi:hypothetical protein